MQEHNPRESNSTWIYQTYLQQASNTCISIIYLFYNTDYVVVLLCLCL